ncbi:transglutaminaseTgpA domain-containing protein [Neobacillus drentensis]|uniref:transglutaminaseTgpA domain-containing protein n=1 Tax=Neobacillus drentensis TaxID=220684 RepID=UPI0030016487
MIMRRDLPSFLLYVFGFLLLWEWLRPVEQLTDTANIETFIIFLVISFALSFFQMKWFWQSIIKLIFILYSINHFYYNAGFFQFTWWKAFLGDAADNLGLIVARNWNDLTSEFRTLLFFILLWLMVYLIHYWLLNRKQIFIFFFLTLVYITVLDTFSPYNAKIAIVRTVVVGFAVMGMLTFFRILQREKVSSEGSFLRKWMVPLAVMIAFSVLVGLAAPKAAPIWPDPVPYLTAAQDKGGKDAAGPHRIGYGEDDTALGGPFIGDANPVFMYDGNGKNYWKMETKDTYTGKGWITSGTTPIPFRQEDLVPVYSFPQNVETIKETVRVNAHVNYKYNYIMYPAGIKKIINILPDDPKGNRYMIDTTNERISFFRNDNRPQVPQILNLEFDVPKYKAADLRVTTGYNPDEISQEFYQQYTQVPEELPQRVKDLAEKITAGKTNWFDKAKAVESYFGNSEFTYDQKNVAVPGPSDDYVDQFLFDTKRGYCDNFSSSMAIMLRTIGIPTRWIKGFNGGDFIKYSTENSGNQIYEVTNNNAHSWVEVFFPNQGWVAFEPTKGFSNELNIDYGTGQSSSGNQSSTPAPVKKPQQEQIEDNPVKKENSFDFQTVWNQVKLFWNENWKLLILALIILVVVAGILYRIRGKWFPFLVLMRYRFKKKDDNIAEAYLILLSQLERYGLKRKDNQTLRNYARYVDSFFSTREMTRLTASYEQYLYHQNLPQGSWKESRKLWENLIKKTIA